MKVIVIVSEKAGEEKEQNCDVIQPMPTAQCLQWQTMRVMEMKMTKRQIRNQMMLSTKANRAVFTMENNERNGNYSNDQKANSTTNDAIHPRSTAQYSQ